MWGLSCGAKQPWSESKKAPSASRGLAAGDQPPKTDPRASSKIAWTCPDQQPSKQSKRKTLAWRVRGVRASAVVIVCLCSSCVRVVCSLCFRLVFYTHTVSSCCRVRAGRGLVPLTRAALCGESHSSYRTVRSSGLVSSGTTQHRPPDSTFHPASQRNLAFTPPLTSMDVKQEEQNGSCLRMVTRVPPVL